MVLAAVDESVFHVGHLSGHAIFIVGVGSDSLGGVGEAFILVIGAKQIIKLDVLELIKLGRVDEFDVPEGERYFLFLPEALSLFLDAGDFPVLEPALEVFLVGFVGNDVDLA